MSRVTDAEERRDQILKAAVAVFSERGYTNATISDIASRAGVAHGTVYLYFKSKAEIFEQLVSWFVDRLIADLNGPAEVDRDGPGSFARDLHRMVHGALEVCSWNRRLAAVCLRERVAEGPDSAAALRALDQVLIEQLSARIARAIEEGEVRPISADFAAFVIVRILGIAIQRFLSLDVDAGVEPLASQTVDFVLRGLAAEPLRNNWRTLIVPPNE